MSLALFTHTKFMSEVSRIVVTVHLRSVVVYAFFHISISILSPNYNQSFTSQTNDRDRDQQRKPQGAASGAAPVKAAN